MAIGLVFLLVAMRLDYRVYRNRTRCCGWPAVRRRPGRGLLLPARASRAPIDGWASASLGIQPSELAKLVAILFVATVLERRLEEHESLDPGLVQASILLVVFAALIIREPDYGSAVVLLATACAMAFVAGLSYRRVVTALVSCRGRSSRSCCCRPTASGGGSPS